jgi:hypothetical protein
MIDPPNLPAKPYSPNRLKLAAIGVGLGLALGLGLAGLAEFSEKRVHSERALRHLVQVRIIADIPHLASPAEEAEQRRQDWLTLAAAGAVFCCISVGFAITYLRG